MDFKEDLSNDMMRMLAKGSTNDVKIVLDDGEIRAHWEILALRCEYFAATFRWAEGNNQEGSGDIRIQDCSKEVMERVIEFLFSGVMRFKDLGLLQLLELVNQVRKLMLRDDMRQKIEDYIRNDVISEANWERGEDGVSCLDLILGIKKAEKLNLDEIKGSLTKEIGENLYIFLLKPEDRAGLIALTKLPFGSLKEISNNCKEEIDTERNMNSKRGLNIALFACFYRWYDENEGTCCDEDKKEILGMVNLELFHLATLINRVKPTGMFPKDEVDRRITDLARKYDEMVDEEEESNEEYN